MPLLNMLENSEVANAAVILLMWFLPWIPYNIQAQVHVYTFFHSAVSNSVPHAMDKLGRVWSIHVSNPNNTRRGDDICQEVIVVDNAWHPHVPRSKKNAAERTKGNSMSLGFEAKTEISSLLVPKLTRPSSREGRIRGTLFLWSILLGEPSPKKVGKKALLGDLVDHKEKPKISMILGPKLLQPMARCEELCGSRLHTLMHDCPLGTHDPSNVDYSHMRSYVESTSNYQKPKGRISGMCLSWERFFAHPGLSSHPGLKA